MIDESMPKFTSVSGLGLVFARTSLSDINDINRQYYCNVGSPDDLTTITINRLVPVSGLRRRTWTVGLLTRVSPGYTDRVVEMTT